MKNSGDYRAVVIATVFWGSMWGLAEATLGHVLHLAEPTGIRGFLMFPIAFLLMRLASRQAGSPLPVLAMGPIAAGLKFLDFFLPYRTPLSIVNPAVAILLESAAVYAALRLWQTWNRPVSLPAAAAPAAAWRLAYLGLSAVLSTVLSGRGGSGHDLLWLARFLLLESVINAVLMVGLDRILWTPGQGWKFLHWAARPAGAAVALVLAISVHFIRVL